MDAQGSSVIVYLFLGLLALSAALIVWMLVTLARSEVDFERAQDVRRDGTRVPLTAKEFEILRALADGGGRIVTIDRLCEAAWGDNPFGYENSLMAHIRRIREKIEADPSHPVSLITVKGLGYRLLTEGR